jgi:hypothetical protein
MPKDDLTLRDYLIAVHHDEVEQFEENVLDLLEPIVLSNYDGWGDAALHNWYQAMLNHLVNELGGPEVVLGMLGIPVEELPPSSGSFNEN